MPDNEACTPLTMNCIDNTFSRCYFLCSLPNEADRPGETKKPVTFVGILET